MFDDLMISIFIEIDLIISGTPHLTGNKNIRQSILTKNLPSFVIIYFDLIMIKQAPHRKKEGRNFQNNKRRGVIQEGD